MSDMFTLFFNQTNLYTFVFKITKWFKKKALQMFFETKLNRIITQKQEYLEINKTLTFIFFIILFIKDYIVFKKGLIVNFIMLLVELKIKNNYIT